MRLAPTLTCAAALSLAACGQDAQPFPPPFATAVASCTKTTAGTLADCLLLQSSVPGGGSWVLDRLREQRFDATLDEGVPVEVSMVFEIVMNRDGATPPAR